MIAVVASIAAAILYYYYGIDYLLDLKLTYAFALLAMGYRNHTLDAWSKFAVADTRILYEPNSVPEIQYHGILQYLIPRYLTFN